MWLELRKMAIEAKELLALPAIMGIDNLITIKHGDISIHIHSYPTKPTVCNQETQEAAGPSVSCIPSRPIRLGKAGLSWVPAVVPHSIP